MRLRTALEIGVEGEPERAEVLLGLGSASHRAGKATDAQEAFESAAEIARGLDRPDLLARAAIGYEEACWRPGVASGQRGRVAGGGARGGRRRRATSCGSACWPGSRGRSASKASPSAGRSCAATPSPWRGASRTARALAKVLVRSYWARGTTPLEEILAMLTEATGPGAGDG